VIGASPGWYVVLAVCVIMALVVTYGVGSR